MRGLAARGNKDARTLLAKAAGAPTELQYLRHWFDELSGTRDYYEGVPMAFKYREVEAWARMNDCRVAPHEVRALVMLDGVYRLELLRLMKHTRTRPKKDETSAAHAPARRRNTTRKVRA